MKFGIDLIIATLDTAGQICGITDMIQYLTLDFSMDLFQLPSCIIGIANTAVRFGNGIGESIQGISAFC